MLLHGHKFKDMCKHNAAILSLRHRASTFPLLSIWWTAYAPLLRVLKHVKVMNKETLGVQESRVVRVIKKQLVKRCIDMMTDLASKGEEEYEKFWGQFGRNVKLGVVDDKPNQEKLAKLLRVRPFLSTQSASECSSND
jgi:hypothetical protein